MNHAFLRRLFAVLLAALCLLPVLAVAQNTTHEIQMRLAFLDESGDEIDDYILYAYMVKSGVESGLESAVNNQQMSIFGELTAGDYTITDFWRGEISRYATPADVNIKVNENGSISSLSSHASVARKDDIWIITIKLKKATYDVRMRLAFVDEDGNEIEDKAYGYLEGNPVDNEISKVVPKLYADVYEITGFVGLPNYEKPDDVVIQILDDGSVECLNEPEYASAALDENGTWVITIKLTGKTGDAGGGYVPEDGSEEERFTVRFMHGDQLWEQTDVASGQTLPIAGMPVPETPEGYVFAGWYTKDGVHVTHGMMVNGDITAYASWRAIPKTGDPSSLMSWLLLLGASGFGMNALRRRKN